MSWAIKKENNEAEKPQTLEKKSLMREEVIYKKTMHEKNKTRIFGNANFRLQWIQVQIPLKMWCAILLNLFVYGSFYQDE